MAIISDVGPSVSLLVASTRGEVLANHLVMFALERLLEQVQPDQIERVEHCQNLVYTQLSHALSYEFVRRFGAPEIRQQVMGMIEGLKRRFIHSIAGTSWISAPSKIEAFRKIGAIKVYIGHSDGFMQQVELEDKFYQGITLDKDQFLQNYLKLERQATLRMLSRANEPPDQALASDADDRIISNYAVYTHDNAVLIMASYLRGFFYQKGRPDYINYASLGAPIAHELAHAFDTENVERDSRCKQTCWWDSETDSAYKNKLRCLIRQYDQADTDAIGYSIDGRRTLNENLADNVGPAIAWAAYLDLAARKSIEPLLPGLERFDQSQLFWLYNAASWCDDLGPEETRDKHESGFHSPPRLRVNLPYSNMAEFARAFKCPPGSPMNPLQNEKCLLFD